MAALIAWVTVPEWSAANSGYVIVVVMSCYNQKARKCYQRVINDLALMKK